MNLPFHEKDLILFTGDSITECHRDQDDPDSLGLGYAGMIADRLGQVLHPRKLRFRNTGISADRIQDLCRRWDRDCLVLQPDWISVLIGVNNTWRR